MSDNLVADIIEGSLKQTFAVTNRVNDLGWEAATEWADRYRILYDLVFQVNDSIKVDKILAHRDYIRDSVESSIEQYRGMKLTHE